MKKMKKRKGFTLTELAIVIAVIAILIAVLVPTFVSLINKAKESSDSQLAKNMNTLLANEEALGDKPTRMDEVNEILVDGGYTIAKLTPSADNNIFVWNEETNRISYISTEDWTVLYAGDSSLTADSVFTAAGNYWVTVESEAEIKTWENLSYYLGCDIDLSDDLEISSASSIDTGTYTLTGNVTYSGTVSSADVSYKTASTSIKKTADTTRNYNNSVVIWGEIDGKVELATKNLTVENNSTAKIDLTSADVTEYTEYGYAKTLDISGNTSTKITISNNGLVEELIIGSSSTSYTNVTNNGYIGDIVESENGTSKASDVTFNVKGYVEKTAETDGSSYTYEISNYSQLASFRDKVNNGKTFAGITVKLTADIDISGRSWVPIGYDSRDNAADYHSGQTNDVYYYFAGTFEGNNHTISGLTNSGYTPTTVRKDTYGTGSRETENYLYGLFGIINGATIQNLTMTNVNIVSDSDIELDSVGAIAGFASGGVKITNCTVYGSIEATDAAAGIIGRIYTYDGAKYDEDNKKWYPSSNTTEGYISKTLNTTQTNVVITNCKNYADITITDTTNTTSKAAGIVGWYSSYSGVSVTIGGDSESYGCYNYGDISANIYTAGIICAAETPVTVKNCVNSGDITSTNTKDSMNKDGSAVAASNAGSIISGSVKSVPSGWTTEGCSNDGGTIKSMGTGYVFDFFTSTTTDDEGKTTTTTSYSAKTVTAGVVAN